MAHIIAASSDGPRGSRAYSDEELAQYDNLILLCSTCHTMIDKAPETFPDIVVAGWKHEHKKRLELMFGVSKFSSRNELRKEVESLLVANRLTFNRYGPHLAYSWNPEAEESNVWKRKVRTVILPNSRKLLAILDANRSLLLKDETEVAEAFRQHVDDLTARHIDTDYIGGGMRFPDQMNSIAKDEESDGL